MKQYVTKLLTRKHRIMSEAKAVYAFGNNLQRKSSQLTPANAAVVCGGTGWTVQLTVDHNKTYPAEWKRLFVYDTEVNHWYELSRGEPWTFEEYGNPPTNLSPFMFLECVRAPLLDKVSAVVGCREFTDCGRKEMKALFARTGSEAYRMSNECNAKYDEWVTQAVNAPTAIETCPPLPEGIPAPPPLEDGQKHPWIFVRNTGWVYRKEVDTRPQWEEKVKNWREMQVQWLEEDMEDATMKAEEDATMKAEEDVVDTCK